MFALCLSVTLVFRTFLRYAFTYLDEASIWRVTDQVRLWSRLTYFFAWVIALFKLRFPDFSSLCFHISERKLVGSFHMKSYRSSSTFATVDLLFHELLPFVPNSFSGLFFTLLSHIRTKVSRKLPYEELQIKFDYRHSWPTFSWVIALYLKFFFRTSLCFHISERKSVGSFHMKSYRSSSTFVMVDLLFHELLPFI